MSSFDRFADAVAAVWAKPWWFAICSAFVVGWIVGLVATQRWNDDVYHLWLNSPTTALTFVGVFLLHNEQSRFEKATNQRLEKLIEAVCGEDPVDDEGQKENAKTGNAKTGNDGEEDA